MLIRPFLGALLISALPFQAHALSGSWDSPLAGLSGNGSTSSTAWIADGVGAEWNRFDNPLTDNSPDIAGSGTLSQTLPGAGSFITSSGNLYSSGGPASLSVALDAALNGTWTIWLRVATQGTVADDIATLNGVAASKTVSYSSTLGGFGGSEEEAWWSWTVTSPLSLDFIFTSSAAHMSLDQLAILAAPVPEPRAWMLLASGLALLGLAPLRRR